MDLTLWQSTIPPEDNCEILQDALATISDCVSLQPQKCVSQLAKNLKCARQKQDFVDKAAYVSFFVLGLIAILLMTLLPILLRNKQ